MPPLPPLMLQAGHVDEVVPLDEHVAGVDRLSEVDDGVVTLVVVVVADLARVSALQDADGTVVKRRPVALHCPVSGRSGCGSGWLIQNHRKRSRGSEERASEKYWEILEIQEPPAGVEPATY